jgi:hypothetical protein
MSQSGSTIRPQESPPASCPVPSWPESPDSTGSPDRSSSPAECALGEARSCTSVPIDAIPIGTLWWSALGHADRAGPRWTRIKAMVSRPVRTTPRHEGFRRRGHGVVVGPSNSNHHTQQTTSRNNMPMVSGGSTRHTTHRAAAPDWRESRRGGVMSQGIRDGRTRPSPPARRGCSPRSQQWNHRRSGAVTTARSCRRTATFLCLVLRCRPGGNYAL